MLKNRYALFPAVCLLALSCSLMEWQTRYENDLPESIADDAEDPDSIKSDAEGEDGNYTAEECDALKWIEISIADMVNEESHCVCAYRYKIDNLDAERNIIVFTHTTARLEERTADYWTMIFDEEITPGGTLTDGGKGVEIKRFGGLYSTCKMEDGEYASPEYYYTDRIGAKFAVPECAWMDQPVEYEKISEELLDACEPE